MGGHLKRKISHFTIKKEEDQKLTLIGIKNKDLLKNA
jgi:hypothetical protein